MFPALLLLQVAPWRPARPGGPPPAGLGFDGLGAPPPHGGPGSGISYLLSTVIWALLFLLVASRFRSEGRTDGRRWLMFGFGAGLVRSLLLLAASVASRPGHEIVPRHILFPLSAWWGLAVAVLLTAAFLRYLAEDSSWGRRYLIVGLAGMAVALVATLQTLAERTAEPLGPGQAVLPLSTATTGLLLLGVGALLAAWLTRGGERGLLLAGIAAMSMTGASHLPAIYRIGHTPWLPDWLRGPLRISPAAAEIHGATFGVLALVVLGYLYVRTESNAVQAGFAALEASLRRRTADLEATLEKLSAANAKLAEQSTLDGLTGLRNRRYFDDQLLREWERSARDHRPLSVALIDVDRFKEINDQFGHAKGDACLVAVAAVATARARRPADVAARYGGDEIAVLLPDTDQKGLQTVAEQARAEIERLDLDGPHLTVSVGAAACIPGPGIEPADLVALADERLYAAKRAGRNRVIADAREREAVS